jgi:cytosine deaminase
MGLPSGLGIAAGAPADLILFPGVRRMSELLARPQLSERLVIRRGRLQRSRLPSFAELDDLVDRVTERVQRDGVQRGAVAASPH